MEDQFIGYLMNALEPEAHEQVAKYLQEHPEAQARLETLSRALEPLAADRDGIDPPPLLAYRSLARVAEYRCRPLPPAPEPPAPAEIPASPPAWWRRADVLVAASLFFAILGVSIPGVRLAQSYKQRVDCANNLLQFHQAVSAYADLHGGNYPGFDLPAPHNAAGMFVPVLHDAGLVHDKLTTRCPAVGAARIDRHSVEGLRLLSPEDYEKAAAKLIDSYAYSLGYRDPASGQLVGLRRSRQGELDNDEIPLLADRPSIHGDQRGNSSNHGGGQNVLHIGGHVRYLTTTAVEGDDNIYCNKHGKVAAGVDRFDRVLGSSGDRP